MPLKAPPPWARETRVAVGAADDELARGVDEELHVLAEELLRGLGQTLHDARQQYLLHVLAYLLLPGVGVVLRADHDGVDALGLAPVAVLHRHLALGVGTQVAHLLALAAYLRQLHQDDVRQRDGQRHQLLGLAAGIAEHHALVAGTLVALGLAADAHIDVLALLVDGAEHTAALGLELVLALGVAYLAYDVAHGCLHVDIAVAGHLAANDSQAGGYQRLAGHMALRVVAQKLVQQSIADLVGHLVGMALADTLTCEEITHFCYILTC